jgi:DNA-binding NarL/FixJ family response regulator
MLFRSPTFRRVTIKMEDFGGTTVLVADRATLFRHGLIRLLQERRAAWSCAEAGTAEEVQSHLSVEPVDLVLLDLPLAGGRALTGLHRLREQHPDQKIAILSDSDERGAILECLAAGASGYILKSATLAQVLRAIETILSGGVFAPAALAGLQQSVAPARDPEATNLALHLTERQIEVFDLLSQGCATKTIARRLGLAVGTVKVHLAGIYRVLGAHNRVEAIARAGGAHVQPVQFAGGGALVGELSA